MNAISDAHFYLSIRCDASVLYYCNAGLFNCTSPLLLSTLIFPPGVGDLHSDSVRLYE